MKYITINEKGGVGKSTVHYGENRRVGRKWRTMFSGDIYQKYATR